MLLLRLLPIFCTLLFILLQSVDVKITKRDRLTVKINFNIIAISLYEDKVKKQRLKQLSKFFKSILGVLKALRYLISKSDITVRIYERSPELYDASDILQNTRIFASSQLVFSYLEAYSRRLNIIRTNAEFDDNFYPNALNFDASIHFSLFNLIISALFFLYYIVKNKAKRVIKNV